MSSMKCPIALLVLFRRDPGAAAGDQRERRHPLGVRQREQQRRGGDAVKLIVQHDLCQELALVEAAAPVDHEDIGSGAVLGVLDVAVRRGDDRALSSWSSPLFQSTVSSMDLTFPSQQVARSSHFGRMGNHQLVARTEVIS
jgi:hypothetical protein